jgi:hypothetical protein
MEKVTCDWATATEADKKQFPDFAAHHKKHGDNMAKCDAWVCPCKNSTDTGGFTPCNELGHPMEPDSKWPNLYSCNNCGRVISQKTGEVIHRYTRCHVCKADIPEGDLCPNGHHNQI